MRLKRQASNAFESGVGHIFGEFGFVTPTKQQDTSYAVFHNNLWRKVFPFNDKANITLCVGVYDDDNGWNGKLHMFASRELTELPTPDMNDEFHTHACDDEEHPELFEEHGHLVQEITFFPK